MARLFQILHYTTTLRGHSSILHLLTPTFHLLSNRSAYTCTNHREPHFHAFKCILRYIWGTLDHELQLYSSPSMAFTAYSDADCALSLAGPPHDFLSFSAITSSLGRPNKNTMCPGPVQRSNIVVSPMPSLRYLG